MTDMTVRPAEPSHRAELLRLRRALWPDCSEEMHAREMANYFTDGSGQTIFVVARPSGSLAGFAEFSVRDRVDGSFSNRVAYLEGWFVEADLRGSGWGRRLVEAGERWARAQGLTELASDTELDNVAGQRAHVALGFRETFRQVHFLKPLN
ncbi:MAG: GNAT family N-acetyltransferase [Verrucomicrobia bacterium]|nr:GNAT family N-acetyltransferase [Verrucomicrobiota bacterium]